MEVKDALLDFDVVNDEVFDIGTVKQEVIDFGTEFVQMQSSLSAVRVQNAMGEFHEVLVYQQGTQAQLPPQVLSAPTQAQQLGLGCTPVDFGRLDDVPLFTFEEMETSVLSLKSNKAPDPDGIPSEALKKVGQRDVRERLRRGRWRRRGRGGLHGPAAGPSPAQEALGGPHQAAHERVHGVVAAAAAQDRPGQPQDAQLRDLQAARCRVEAANGEREAALHRRGEATQGHAHEGTPGLQVQAAQEAEDAAEGGIPVHDALPVSAHRRSQSWHGRASGLLLQPRGGLRLPQRREHGGGGGGCADLHVGSGAGGEQHGRDEVPDGGGQVPRLQPPAARQPGHDHVLGPQVPRLHAQDLLRLPGPGVHQGVLRDVQDVRRSQPPRRVLGARPGEALLRASHDRHLGAAPQPAPDSGGTPGPRARAFLCILHLLHLPRRPPLLLPALRSHPPVPRPLPSTRRLTAFHRLPATTHGHLLT